MPTNWDALRQNLEASGSNQPGQTSVAASTAPSLATSSSGTNWGNLAQSLSNAQQVPSQGANSGVNTAMQTANDPGSFAAGVDNFNRVFGNIAQGTMDVVSRAMGTTNITNSIASVNKNMNSNADAASAAHPVAGAIGTGLGVAGLTPYVMVGGEALGVGGASTLAGSVLQNAGVGATLGGLNYAPTMADRGKNAITGGLLGGTLAGVIGGGAKLMVGDGEMSSFGQKVINPKQGAVDDVNTVNAPKQQLQQTLDSMVPGGIDKVSADQAPQYDALKSINIAPDTVDTLMQDPVIASKMKELNSELGSQFKDLPDNNLGKLDAVKQKIQEDMYKSTYKPNPDAQSGDLSASQLPAWKQAQAKLIGALDNDPASQDAGYQELRQVGEKKAIYSQYTRLLNDTPDVKGASPMLGGSDITTNKSIDSLFKTIAGTPTKQDMFLDQIAKAGGDVDNAKGIIKALSNLRTNSVDSIIQKSSLSEGAKGMQGITGKLSSFKDNLLGGNYNNSVLKIALSGPNMQQTITNTLNNSNTARMLSGLNDLLDSVKNSPVGDVISKGVNSGTGQTLAQGVAQYGLGTVAGVAAPSPLAKTSSTIIPGIAAYGVGRLLNHMGLLGGK